ncbi:hypothetical protein BG015_004718 [Linnemannia schmuckeri]|uniref:C2H2-type domain-containing protein n=1 Tax=Linnemannia schmuckeri TaxID=64567 RepID=A0A9P5S922_9FUNG|nr:hypothetical protein BG015_004718 [Linnemannia schmuckeri]
MILPSLSAMTFSDQKANAAIPSQPSVALNATAINTNNATNSNYIPDLSPAQLMSFNFNPDLAFIPPTLQAMPMTSTIPLPVSNHNMTSAPHATLNCPPVSNNSQQLSGDFIACWKENHESSLGNNNLTTYGGFTSISDLNLILNSGRTWPDMPQVTRVCTTQIPTTNDNGNQGFDINSPPLSILSVNQHQQQDVSYLLNPPGVGTSGVSSSGSIGQSSGILVAPYVSNTLGPSSLFLQQQQQQQQQQKTPILASQQLYYPTMATVNNSNNMVQSIDSSSFSSTIVQYDLQHQQHNLQHQQQQHRQPEPMHHFYQNVHMRLQGQEQQLQQQQQQLVISQGDTTASSSSAVIPSFQTITSSLACVPPPNQAAAYGSPWTINPNAALTVPVSSDSPSSPAEQFSSYPSSASVDTPQANPVPGSSGYQQQLLLQKCKQISTGGDDVEYAEIMLVEQQLLAAAMDLKDFQYQSQDQNQTQSQALSQNQLQVDDRFADQTQVQPQPHVQTQTQAQDASSQEGLDHSGSLNDESDVGNRLTLYPGAIHQEQLQNYRGYRHYSYDQSGSPQAIQNHQGGNEFSSTSSSSTQQQPAVSHHQQFEVGQTQVDSHGSPGTGLGTEQSLVVHVQVPALRVDASHGSLGTGLGTDTDQSLLVAQAQLRFPPAAASASASAASSMVGTPTEFNNNQLSSTYFPPPPTGNNNTQQQQLSYNDNDTINTVGTNNCRPILHPLADPETQDLYYGFSFEPQEGFQKPSTWPALVSGVPLTATANDTADLTMESILDSVSSDIKNATAQLRLHGGMSLSDAFLSSMKVDPNTCNALNTGGVVDPAIQSGDEVVVVVKREKKSGLGMNYDANDDEKQPDHDCEVIPYFVRRAAAVAARAAAAAVTASRITTNSSNNTNNVVAGQDNNRNNGHEHFSHHGSGDDNDDGDEEYVPPSPFLPPTGPAPHQNNRGRVSKKGAIQKTTPATTEPTMHKCEIPHCDKEFTTAGLLKSHKVSHDPEKPYWCDICSEDGITPRPADPTPLFPGMPIPIPEVKKYKRHHDLLRHKREQHPPLAVKIQRFQEKMEAKEARRVKADEVRRQKAALKRAEKAAAQAANPTAGRGRRGSSAAATAAAARCRTSSVATITTAAPRGRRASSTAAAIAVNAAAPIVAPAAEAPKSPRKRKLMATKRSTTNDENDDEDSDYQENGKKRRRSKTSSTSGTISTPAANTSRCRRTSASQTQSQQQENEQTSISSASVMGSIQLQGPGEHQYNQQLQAPIQQVQQALQARRRSSASLSQQQLEQLKREP